jgi:hypothetical protein
VTLGAVPGKKVSADARSPRPDGPIADQREKNTRSVRPDPFVIQLTFIARALT